MTDHTNQYNQVIELLRARPMTRAELAAALSTSEPNVRGLVIVLKDRKLVDAPIGRRWNPGLVSLTPLGVEFEGWIPRLNSEEQRKATHRKRVNAAKGRSAPITQRIPNSVFALGAL